MLCSYLPFFFFFYCALPGMSALESNITSVTDVCHHVTCVI